jgi:hypothetical protein
VRLPAPAVVASVEPGSIAEELGFQPGDRLLSINGKRPRDLIDVQMLVGEEELTLEVEDPDGSLHTIELEKDLDEGLGLGFTEALFDGLKQCNNACPFCFIDQQPPGRRSSLYLKDDDYRLSFLYGSYLTLTNLTAADWQRIEEQRLSPLFVSVHATEPELRSRLLVNPRAALLLDQLGWFAQRDLYQRWPGLAAHLEGFGPIWRWRLARGALRGSGASGTYPFSSRRRCPRARRSPVCPPGNRLGGAPAAGLSAGSGQSFRLAVR